MAGVEDAIWFDRRGNVYVRAEDLLACSEFQSMTLEERGALISRKLSAAAALAENPSRYIPVGDREAVARRYGAEPGGSVTVACHCGAVGSVEWDGPRIRFIGFDLDHVHPVSRGGPSVAANLQLLCPSCNRSKGAKVES